MKEIVEVIAKAIVNNPSEVQVEEVHSNHYKKL